MADLYGLHPLDGNSYRSSSATTLDSLSLPANSPMASAYYSHLLPGFASEHFRPVSSAACDTAVVEAEIATARTNSEEESAGVIRAKIASHPLYPKLVDAFVNCQKVGVSPEFANILDQNNQGSDIGKETSGVSTSFGADPELDKFMGTYYGILAKYELDLSQSFVEASSFLNNMEMQLNMLCNGTTRSYVSGLLERKMRELKFRRSFASRPENCR